MARFSTHEASGDASMRVDDSTAAALDQATIHLNQCREALLAATRAQLRASAARERASAAGNRAFAAREDARRLMTASSAARQRLRRPDA